MYLDSRRRLHEDRFDYSAASLDKNLVVEILEKTTILSVFRIRIIGQDPDPYQETLIWDGYQKKSL